MYCPKCGSHNQDEPKFCTSCGMGLAPISSLLAGAPTEKARVEDWVEKLLKKYYSGRRDAVTGLLLIPGAFLIMEILKSSGMPPFVSFLWVCWMFFWGVIAVAEGVGKWLASSGEIKSLGYRLSQGKLAPAGDPIEVPPSVTEQTTRSLEERPSHAYLERKSGQT
jgi:hypothetical protein